VLLPFAGVAVHDALASYRRYDLTHALCAAHHLRELTGIAEATDQAWPTELAELPVQMHVAVQATKADGKSALSPQTVPPTAAATTAPWPSPHRQNPPPAGPAPANAGRPRAP